MGQVYQCWWRICREIHFFTKFDYHKFYVLYQFVTYLLTLPRTNYNRKRHGHLYQFRCNILFTKAPLKETLQLLKYNFGAGILHLLTQNLNNHIGDHTVCLRPLSA
jgi:hypothetical protein